jgi:hypothetical protein
MRASRLPQRPSGDIGHRETAGARFDEQFVYGSMDGRGHPGATAAGAAAHFTDLGHHNRLKHFYCFSFVIVVVCLKAIKTF